MTIHLLEKYFLVCMNLICDNMTGKISNRKKAVSQNHGNRLFSGNIMNRVTENAYVFCILSGSGYSAF